MTDTQGYQRFFAEMKRRRVFRVMAVYGVVAFAIIEAADAMFPRMALPDWTVTFVVWLALLGFPIAIVLAWAFEMTPEGMRRTAEAAPGELTEIIAAPASKSWPAGVLALLGMMALLAGAWYVGRQSAPASDVDTAVGVSEASIAVLPFVNMSDDASNEYFSEGISEELLNLLAKIPELRVAARTSSFSFKGKDLEIQEIASRLKVAHILEGSVRKSDNQIRITAQLIQADNGYHVWSETYDRQLGDVFQIQEDIAIAVVDALRISLLGEAPKTRRTDPQTYQLFLEGQYLRRQITSASLHKAVEAFKQAVEIDPTYVPAWADLADTYLWLGEDALADQAIQTAISIDPDYAYVYYVRGVLRIFGERRFKAGIEDFQHALELDPDDAFIIAAIGKGAFVTGDFDLAIQQFQAGLRVEPVVPEFYFFLGMAYRGAGRFDDAEASFRRMLSLSPQYRYGHFLCGRRFSLRVS